MRESTPPEPSGPLISRPSAPPLTAAAALGMIEGWTDLTPVRRRDLASSVNAAVRVAGLSPDAVLLHPTTLRETLLSRPARALGIGDRRLRNIRSGLRLVLGRAGVIDHGEAPISSAWEKLLDLLPVPERRRFVGFARFCSLRQVVPDAVTAEVLAAFEAHLIDRTLVAEPRKHVGQLRSAWNRNCRSQPGWPATPLPKPDDARRYVLPITDFPAAFQADLKAFVDRLACNVLDEPFDDEAELTEESAALMPEKPLRPSTIETRTGHCVWAASALVASGTKITEIVSLTSLVEPLPRAKDALQFLYQRAGRKPSAAGGHVAEILRIIAKHHARRPETEVSQIRKWGKPVRLEYKGMTVKNEATVRTAMEPARERALLRLPGILMELARKFATSSPDRARSLAFRAVAIGFLNSRPFRRKNLVHLRLDQLHRPDPKTQRITGLLIDGAETKTGASIMVSVSDRLSDLLTEWIGRFRKAPPGSPWVFPGHLDGNRPITPQALHTAVTDATARYAGVRLSPHQFRHLAAYRHLDSRPRAFEAVRQLLGHADLKTTTRFYAGPQADACARDHDEVLEEREVGMKSANSRAGSQPRQRRTRRGR